MHPSVPKLLGFKQNSYFKTIYLKREPEDDVVFLKHEIEHVKNKA